MKFIRKRKTIYRQKHILWFIPYWDEVEVLDNISEAEDALYWYTSM